MDVFETLSSYPFFAPPLSLLSVSLLQEVLIALASKQLYRLENGADAVENIATTAMNKLETDRANFVSGTYAAPEKTNQEDDKQALPTTPSASPAVPRRPSACAYATERASSMRCLRLSHTHPIRTGIRSFFSLSPFLIHCSHFISFGEGEGVVKKTTNQGQQQQSLQPMTALPTQDTESRAKKQQLPHPKKDPKRSKPNA